MVNNTIRINSSQELFSLNNLPQKIKRIFVNEDNGLCDKIRYLFINEPYQLPLSEITVEGFLHDYNRRDRRLPCLLLNHIIEIMLNNGPNQLTTLVKFKKGIKIPHGYLAERFGVSREWVCKLLRRFERLGIISAYRHRIRHPFRSQRAIKRYRPSVWLFLAENIKILKKILPALGKVWRMSYQQRSFTYIKQFFLFINKKDLILKYVRLIRVHTCNSNSIRLQQAINLHKVQIERGEVDTCSLSMDREEKFIKYKPMHEIKVDKRKISYNNINVSKFIKDNPLSAVDSGNMNFIKLERYKRLVRDKVAQFPKRGKTEIVNKANHSLGSSGRYLPPEPFDAKLRSKDNNKDKLDTSKMGQDNYYVRLNSALKSDRVGRTPTESLGEDNYYARLSGATKIVTDIDTPPARSPEEESYYQRLNNTLTSSEKLNRVPTEPLGQDNYYARLNRASKSSRIKSEQYKREVKAKFAQSPKRGKIETVNKHNHSKALSQNKLIPEPYAFESKHEDTRLYFSTGQYIKSSASRRKSNNTSLAEDLRGAFSSNDKKLAKDADLNYTTRSDENNSDREVDGYKEMQKKAMLAKQAAIARDPNLTLLKKVCGDFMEADIIIKKPKILEKPKKKIDEAARINKAYSALLEKLKKDLPDFAIPEESQDKAKKQLYSTVKAILIEDESKRFSPYGKNYRRCKIEVVNGKERIVYDDPPSQSFRLRKATTRSFDAKLRRDAST